MSLVQVVEADSDSVIAAGGIADGSGAAAGFAVSGGRSGRFCCRCITNAHQNGLRILKARGIDTTISAQHFGHAVRAIKQ